MQGRRPEPGSVMEEAVAKKEGSFRGVGRKVGDDHAGGRTVELELVRDESESVSVLRHNYKALQQGVSLLQEKPRGGVGESSARLLVEVVVELVRLKGAVGELDLARELRELDHRAERAERATLVVSAEEEGRARKLQVETEMQEARLVYGETGGSGGGGEGQRDCLEGILDGKQARGADRPGDVVIYNGPAEGVVVKERAGDGEGERGPAGVEANEGVVGTPDVEELTRLQFNGATTRIARRTREGVYERERVSRVAGGGIDWLSCAKAVRVKRSD